MSGISATTDAGTTISLEPHDETGEVRVYLDLPTGPSDMRDTPAGRIVQGHFQPTYCLYALGPRALRALADLIETTQKEG